MLMFDNRNIAGPLGYAPIAATSDAEVVELLLTPDVRTILGALRIKGEPELTDSLSGRFPGDEVSNLNRHRIVGGGRVRFPYLATYHFMRYGLLVIKRDRFKLKVDCWHGDPFAGAGELMYRVALRDRVSDGTPAANDCALLGYKQSDPVLCKPLPVGSAVELSTYGFKPGSNVCMQHRCGQFGKFLSNPFSFLKRPRQFLRHFHRAWTSGRAPGQIGEPIEDAAKYMLSGLADVAIARGYDFIEAAASHYHVLMWTRRQGYRLTYQTDVELVEKLSSGMARILSEVWPLTRPQQSWVCVLQNLRPIELIPKRLYIGIDWPQTNYKSQRNLWLHRPLHPLAEEMLPSPLAA
jgi:hypothetical protein